LLAEQLCAERDRDDAWIGVRDPERAAMLRHLRQILADQSRVLLVLANLRVVEQIPTGYTPDVSESILGVGLHTADPRAPHVLPLLRDLRRRGRDRDVR